MGNIVKCSYMGSGGMWGGWNNRILLIKSKIELKRKEDIVLDG